MNRAAIICVITGQTYPSLRAAAEATGVSIPTATASLKEGKAVMHRSLGTYTWLINDQTPPLQPPRDNRQRSIHCVTTNITYATMSEAAQDHQIDLTSLSRAIRQDRPLHSNKLGKKVYFRT